MQTPANGQVSFRVAGKVIKQNSSCQTGLSNTYVFSKNLANPSKHCARVELEACETDSNTME